MRKLASPALSLAAVAGAAWQIWHADPSAMLGTIPAAPIFWTLLLSVFLTAPIADWATFNLLWGRAPGGFKAVLRRTILNSAVLSYLGDAYLLGWARERSIESRRALPIIRDVALISAIVGGLVTVALATYALPALERGGHTSTAMLWSSVTMIMVITGVTIVIAARTIALSATEILAAAALAVGRTLITAGLTALLWHMVLPEVAVGEWAVLAALRLMVLRLPLVPNKEIAFAATATMIVGGSAPIAAAIALVAFLLLAVQLLGSLLLMVSMARESGAVRLPFTPRFA